MMKKRVLACAALLLCLTGCDVAGSDLVIDTAPPFTGTAVLHLEHGSHNAVIEYLDTGELVLDTAPEHLTHSLVQRASDSGTEVEMYEQHFSYPADWVSSANMSQLIRHALKAPQTVTKQGDKLVGEGMALGIPFIVESDAEGKILLMLSFPSIGTKIELTDFVR